MGRLDSRPIEMYETIDRAYGAWAQPNCIYLNVTDAVLDDVQFVWTLIEWPQAVLRAQCLATTSRERPSQELSGLTVTITATKPLSFSPIV